MELAQRPIPHVEFVLRHVPITTTDASPRSTLSGYGVALDLKKTDYLAVDDRFMKKKGALIMRGCFVDLTNLQVPQTTDRMVILP